ncbi:tRNA (adenosine(37)-N6)-threonylcarbamoyltransferase complex transferase subunit TsaD [Patescibacteria group bacterium]|nr:tRNA (adenosine(37)-N6)-threonylcarbamoyltransferase complex transferase subunit TsaD [Patescibacteria group bacterium]
MRKFMKIFAVETSCDETALVVIEAEGGFSKPRFDILINLVSSQVKTHAPFGGVVPRLAKREHQRNLPILFKKIQDTKHKIQNADVIAVTVGPGLEPCLWEGINFARGLAEEYRKPIVAANHMEGHIASVLLHKDEMSSARGSAPISLKVVPTKLRIAQPAGVATAKDTSSFPVIHFPAIALLVSGGHTELVFMKKWLDYKIIGETLDDAVGEAFDKVGRLLGLPFPGGPKVAKLASTVRHRASNIKLPRPMIKSPDFNFSFSGLKTAVLYALRENPKLNKALVAREFEDAAVEVLVAKTLKAVRKFNPKTVILGGGVAANKHLQKELKKILKISFLYPEGAFTGDNAAMIAAASYFHALKKDFTKPKKLRADGRLSFGQKKVIK